MKINFINKILILITIILPIAILCKIINYSSWDRYYYFSSACTPESSPIKLQDCYFITANEDEYGRINKEDIETNYSTWGKEYYTFNSTESLRLPKQLVLKYVTYRGYYYYHDTISLPLETIKNIFKEANENNQYDDLHNNYTKTVKGLRFLIGIDNDNIIIWMRGNYLEKIILKTRLKPKQLNINGRNKSSYLNKIFDDLSIDLKTKIDLGWKKKANYTDSTSHYLDK